MQERTNQSPRNQADVNDSTKTVEETLFGFKSRAENPLRWNLKLTLGVQIFYFLGC